VLKAVKVKLAAKKATKVTLKLSAAQLKAIADGLKRKGGAASVTFTVVATDAAGNARKTTVKVTLTK
jgi:hypothetical protein